MNYDSLFRVKARANEKIVSHIFLFFDTRQPRFDEPFAKILLATHLEEERDVVSVISLSIFCGAVLETLTIFVLLPGSMISHNLILNS